MYILQRNKFNIESIGLQFKFNLDCLELIYKYMFFSLLPTGAIGLYTSQYGPGTGLVYSNDIRCTGSENVLANCSHSVFGQVGATCRTHLYDASVSCPTGT